MDAYFEGAALPEQYTARNVAVLVQALCRGFVYLSAFIFSANALGLAGVGPRVVARERGWWRAAAWRETTAGVPAGLRPPPV